MPDIQSIAAQFENQTLPKEQWTHHAHIAVAFAHLEKYKNEELALPNLRQGIKAYNTAVGTANTDTSGYHETLTVFWLRVISEYASQTKADDIEKRYEGFLRTFLSSPQLPARFYSGELLFSKAARQSWTDPDLLAISALRELVVGAIVKG
jgi:hypothetical protein